MTPPCSIRLTPSAQALFPDIGDRSGVLLRVEGWAVVDWNGMQARLPVECLQASLATPAASRSPDSAAARPAAAQATARRSS